MQRKAYVPGIAALLAALLAGCTGGSASDGTAADPKPGDVSVNTPAAQPGKYRTLPEACAAVSHDSLDSLLPGIKQITDQDQRDTAYEGQATLTYDTDRRVGCGWKVDSTDATDHLSVDFERVVSYDNTVSDDSRAQDIYATEETAANLPEASPSATPSDTGSATSTPSATPSTSASSTASSTASASASTSAGPSETPADLQPRKLSSLGDEAFLNDKLNSGTSTAQQRTVTVVFRTSNVIVRIEYAEQPTASTGTPDSEEMQDKARNLAQKLVDRLNG
ncbi:hypothetical protein [Streptomyces olivochromogenes]|uniref:DUF3558 domain-containing protein n=1 Tax=Streptomyces olivochromogenes TaxID=1963 RepID=A0A250VER7_STROL|nr:hypothetical protein [Streptomyces olivochromogenes]KUN46781.1 hypothetical protein AQJ27_14980 [Streptomyces olivochromogenes]GAX52564.1 hypothetical protein SO3561_04080 [Streptomyces olivochromogenes]